LQALCERESYWLRQRIESFKGRKYVIFPAGPTAQEFYYTLLNDYGIETEFFIDNNTKLDGQNVCGKPVKACPWEQNSSFNEEYTILIPTSIEFYLQIAGQLEKSGVRNYMHAYAFEACQLWERYRKTLNLLYDESSRIAYLGAIYSLLTSSNEFVQREGGKQYFALREFSRSDFEIIVDAGAFVGDTVEEYVKHHNKVKIYAFEPFGKALEKLKSRVKRLQSEWFLGDDDIVIVTAGVGAETKKQPFSVNAHMMLKTTGKIGTGEDLLVYSLDDYFKDKKAFSLLKADVEGGELDMLKGAAETIRQHKPKMALSIYHNAEDFARIAEYVHELVPEYHMAVRNHSMDYHDTVLYCWRG
jgi:FkbM family methyltransferase